MVSCCDWKLRCGSSHTAPQVWHSYHCPHVFLLKQKTQSCIFCLTALTFVTVTLLLVFLRASYVCIFGLSWNTKISRSLRKTSLRILGTEQYQFFFKMLENIMVIMIQCYIKFLRRRTFKQQLSKTTKIHNPFFRVIREQILFSVSFSSEQKVEESAGISFAENCKKKVAYTIYHVVQLSIHCCVGSFRGMLLRLCLGKALCSDEVELPFLIGTVWISHCVMHRLKPANQSACSTDLKQSKAITSN